MDKIKLHEYLEKGYIYIELMFEVVGNPKEHIVNALKLLIEKIKEEKRIIMIKENFGEPAETPDKLWSTYCATEMLVRDVETLDFIVINFAPASIEIKEPKQLILKDKQLTDHYSEILAATHEMNTRLILVSSQSEGLLRNLNAIMRNTVLLSIAGNISTAAEIGKRIGVTEKDLEPLLEAMIKEKTIIKKGEKYERKVK